jgi:hypothetical protein
MCSFSHGQYGSFPARPWHSPFGWAHPAPAPRCRVHNSPTILQQHLSGREHDPGCVAPNVVACGLAPLKPARVGLASQPGRLHFTLLPISAMSINDLLSLAWLPCGIECGPLRGVEPSWCAVLPCPRPPYSLRRLPTFWYWRTRFLSMIYHRHSDP